MSNDDAIVSCVTLTGSEYVAMLAQAAELAKEITSLLNRLADERTENMRLRAALGADKQTLRLHLGEMTAQEMRTLKAGFAWVLSRAALAAQPAPSGWRPIETAPRDGSRMLLAYQTSLGKWRRVIAFYAPKLSVEQSDYNSDWCEYDEAGDSYFLPEGWYECIENWDDYSSVHMSGVEPRRWMPLPPAPGKEEDSDD